MPAGDDDLVTPAQRVIERSMKVVAARLALVAQRQPEDDPRGAANHGGGDALRDGVGQREQYTSAVVRNVLALIAIVLAAIVAINLIFTSDRERVEDEMLRLFEVAREGGEDAVVEILDAFAEDYRGTGYYSLPTIERRLRMVLVPAGRLKELKHGSIDAVVKGSEIVIPTVSIEAEFGRDRMRVIVAVTWAQRGGDWKIVDIQRWKFGE